MKKILVLVSLVALFSACTEKIDINLDESSSKVVIEGSITNELKEHKVRVTRSIGYLDEHHTPEIQGTRVYLSDGTEEIQLTEVSQGVFKTIPAMAGICGKTYTLRVVVDAEEYTAISTLRQVVPMDSIKVSKAPMPLDPNQIWLEGKTYYNLGPFMQEPADQVNYYLFEAYKNGSIVNDTLTKKRFYDDIVVNGSYIHGMNVIQADAQPGDQVNLTLYSINKDFYDFLVALYQSSLTGSPFSGTPANVQTNFSNGACGFFWTGAMSEVQGSVK